MTESERGTLTTGGPTTQNKSPQRVAHNKTPTQET